MTKLLEITPEIHHAWLDIEMRMANFFGDKPPIVALHDHVGKAIYGKNLEEAKFHLNNFGRDKKIRHANHIVDDLKLLEIL